MRVRPSAKLALNGVFWVAVAALVLNLGRLWLGPPNARASGAVVPYTVTLEQTLPVPVGNAHSGSGYVLTATWAVRSDGSRAGRFIEQPGTTRVRRFVYLASGKRIEISDSTGKKSTTYDPTKSPMLRDPQANCLLPGSQETIAGEEAVAGFRAVKLVRANLTSWYALDHGCAPLGDRFDWGVKGVSEKRLVRLIPGEPAADLFADPLDYQEVPPSVLLGPEGERNDAYYNAHRPK